MRPNFYPKSIFSFLFYFLTTLLIGTQTGNAQTTPATALSFNPSLTVGDNSRLNYVSVANPYNAFQKEITVEFWMNPATANLPFGSVMGQSNNNSSDNFSGGEVWLMHPNTNGTMTFFVNDGGTLRGTTCNIIANSWHHYAAVASASSTKFYVDGVLVHTGPGISGTIPLSPSSVIHIGKDVRFATRYAVNNDPQNRYATMALDEVRIWSRALCADEINFNKNAEINPTGQNGLQEYYRFNQGFVGANNASITSLIDFSGNNRNGVLNNFTLNGTTSNWSASGATNTGIVNAFVQQTATISGNTSICAGSTTTLTSSLSGGKWSSSNTAVATINETTGVVTAISAGTTTITYTTECAQGSISFTVKALPNSTISAGGATTICPGTFVTLSAVQSSGNTYQWFNNGNSINSATNATYNAANSGAYTVRVTNNGCTSTSSSPISINAVDAIKPAINGTVTITTPLNANGAVVATSENGAVVNFNLPTATDNCTQNVTVVALPASGSVFPLGTSEVNIIATDASGNSVQSKFYITVTGRAPSIVVPANIISCDPVVSFTATDNVGIPASTISYSIAPGSTFPVGTTTVTATATNEFGTSSNTFTVTVNKPVADVVTTGATTFCEGGNVTFNAGQYGLQFNGAQDVNVVNGFAATDDITIEATIKPAVIADGSFRVIMNHNSWYTGTVHFQFYPDGRLQFALNGAVPADQYATYYFIPNTTYRIAAVYSRSGKFVKFYVNGVLINTATYTSTVSVVGNAGYRIGSWNGNDRFFKGTIDDLKIWNVQRTNAEVLADASALPIPSGTPNLVRYYKFNEGAGTTTADAAGNGNGTLVNNPIWVTTAPAGQSYLWSNGAITPSIAATATGSYSVTVTDAAGCTTTSTPIAVTVNKAPVFTVCAPNQTVDNASGLNSAVVSYTATATGTPAANLTYTLSGATTGSGTGTGSGSSFNIGTTTVTITATNSCGSTTCTFTVKVNDATPPTINTIPDINAVATLASGAVVTYTSPVGADNMPGATTVQTSGLASGAVFPIGTTINTFKVTDAAGLTATSTFKVIVAGVAPSITVPANISVNNDANTCGAVVNFTATETNGIPASTITYSHQPGSVFPVGTTTVTATATNMSGTSAKTFTVTVVDNQFPVISNPPTNIVVSCESLPSLTQLTVTDNCSIANSLMYQTLSNNMQVDLLRDFKFENNLSDSKVNTTASNINGVGFTAGILGSALNFDGATRYIRLDPSSSMSGPINFAISVWVKTSSNNSMTIIQQREGDVNGQYILNVNATHNGTLNAPGQVYFMVYDNLRGFQFEIKSSNRINDGKWHHIVAERQGGAGRLIIDGVQVGSANGPVVELNASIPTSIGRDVRDNNKQFIGQIDQLKIYAGGATPTNYDLERTWAYTDASGNKSIAQQIVTVEDNTPPVIGNATITTPTDANGAVTATSASGAIVNYTMPTAMDNCSGSRTVTTSKASGTIFPIGTTTVTFTSVDAVGNVATKTLSVTVTGVTPSIVVPSTITVDAPANACNAAVTFAATETTGIPASTITYTVNGQPVASGATFPVGTTTVTATATNAVGSSTATFDVVVKDVTAPIIGATTNVNAIATSAAGAVVNYTLPTATDNCSGNVTVVATPASGSTFAIGTTTVNVTATDAAGNESTTSFTVTVVGVPPVIVVPATIRVDASATNCGAAVNFAATESTAIPASTITYTVNGQPVVSGASFPLGTTTITATATNAVGSSSATFDIVVTDNTAPAINTPAAQVFCENTAGTYSLQAVSASDNCGIATVSFAITGATTRSGVGYDAGTAFNVGTSTITYTVTDVNGNISTKTLVVTVNKAPTATITTSNPDAFCNKLTVIGNSTSPITGYAWTYNGNAFAGTQAISLDNTNGDGTYSLLVTDNKGCTSLAAVTYQYSKQNTISNYTILAYKEAELKEYNTVQTGSVGVMSKKGEAEIGKNSSVAAPGAFVKAPKIEVKQGANVPVRLVGVASVSLPTMQYNSANTSSLPNYTTNAGATISLSGNYKNLKIRKGSNVVLSGTTFGNIDIEEGSVVRFTSTVINIEHLKVGKGPNNGFTQVRFANNTSVRVSKHVQIDEDCFINPDANQVTFYLGRQSNHDCNKHKNKYGNGHDKDRDDDDDDDHDRGHGDGDQKFEVKGGNTTVIANVYAPTGDIKVKGGEGCHKNHSNTTVRMTGLFIGYEVEGEGRNIIWNNYACGSASPLISTDVLPVYNKTAEPQEVADDLKVTVMPNPSTTYFTLKLASKSELPVNIKVVDAAGRIVDVKAKQPANSNLQIGHNYTTGSYFAEFIQGNQRKVIQLIKLK